MVLRGRDRLHRRGPAMSEPLGLGLEEPADRQGAFPRLDDQQRARLRALGTARPTASGDILFRGRRRRLRLLRGRVRCGDDRPGVRRPKPGHSRPWGAPVPGRAQPADGLTRLPDRGRARRGRGDPGARERASTGCLRGRGAKRSDPARFSRQAFDPDRPWSGRQARRLAVLRGQPPAARISRPQPGAPSSGSTSSRTRRRTSSSRHSRSARMRRRSWSGAPRCCAIPQTPSWRACSVLALAVHRPRCATS